MDQFSMAAAGGENNASAGSPDRVHRSGLSPMRPPNMNDTLIEGFVQKKDGPIQNVWIITTW